MKIVDTFIFFDELDLLEDRFKFLYDHVDHFVIIESNRKFGGEKKPLLFQENKLRFAKYLDKIIHKPLLFDEDMDFRRKIPTNQNAEYTQRDYTKQAVAQFSDHDIILSSDVDEIPNPEKFEELKNLFKNYDNLVVRFIQEMYYYNLSCKQILSWGRMIACRKTLFDKYTATFIRLNSYQLPSDERFFEICSGGWHLTNFMPVSSMLEKVRNYPHETYITQENLDPDVIRRRIKFGIDLFNRKDMETSKVGFDHLPTNFLDAFSRWKHYNGENI